jgi:4a-hydroxytetrahydrobiopterin dehydratase
MARPTAMTQEQIAAALRDLPEWTLRDGAIRRSVKLDDFVSAFGFMSSMALVSEALNHHPEWSNVYDRIEIALNTHDAKGITTLDFEWARRAEKLLAK